MTDADVLIIGGGAVGASTAFHLGRLGCKGVTLVERGSLASGASGKGSAIVNVGIWHASRPLVKMLIESIEVYNNFSDKIGGGSGFVQSGWIGLSGSDRESQIRKISEIERSLGADTRVLSVEEIKQLVPGLFTDDLKVAVYESRSGYADTLETTTSLADQAEKLGARILTETEATKIQIENGRAIGVETNKGPINAHKILVAANVWAPKLLREIDVEVPITPVRKQVCTFKLPKRYGRPQRAIDDFVGDLYFRPEGDYTLAGEIETPGTPTDLQNFPAGFDNDIALRLARKLRHRYPAMSSAINRGGYSGPYDVSPDGHPILDAAPGVKDLYMALGFSGHGFRFSPVTGRLMAEFIMNGRTEGIDIREFRLSRFDEGKPIQPLA
ncbi:MAG TPA: FAD-binding oxidoreductase [Candidatus Bathyarchaeia archaeon]|nr:FAD-binding oxidoreductase [Candidatus Bathyarchaeia archaeon]